MQYLVRYTGGKIQGSVDLPGSKSIAIRLLLIRELTGSGAAIDGLPDNEDTVLMMRLLDKIRSNSLQTFAENKNFSDTDSSLELPTLTIDCGNTGTVFRFLTSYLAITPGRWLLTGSERMQQRPVGSLVDALKSIGSDISYLGKNGYPPILINGKNLNGGEVFIKSNESSQFISSLLMISPVLPLGLTIHLEGEKVSEPYIEMTLSLLQKCGISIEKLNHGYYISPQRYIFDNQTVEKDWSATSCWYESMALAKGGSLLLKGISKESVQGDANILNIYKLLGVNSSFTREGLLLTKNSQTPGNLYFNLQHMPDLMPSLAAVMAGNNCKGTITGIAHLRIKESDRISVMQEELFKIGYIVDIQENNLIFNGNNSMQNTRPLIRVHQDHRIVMAIAPLALIIKELIIDDPMSVNKSYPGFWKQLQSIGFQVIKLLIYGSA